ncbi:VOC family protein [Nocardioides sp. GCM10027113]|uniref:VOC family protein n=1 Tax=unclassified Nocardioides TaxID=2615069 RepID=UPI00361A7B0A
MTDPAREFQVTFDCADPAAQAEFWAAALHYIVQPPPEPFGSWDEALEAWGVPEDQRNSRSAIVDPEGRRPRVFFQRVPEGKTVKNRVHLDVRAAHGTSGDERRERLEAERDRLVALGASVFRVLEPTPMDELVIVMQDPEGNEFCLD